MFKVASEIMLPSAVFLRSSFKPRPIEKRITSFFNKPVKLDMIGTAKPFIVPPGMRLETTNPTTNPNDVAGYFLKTTMTTLKSSYQKKKLFCQYLV